MITEVVKRDGTHAKFSKKKIVKAIYKAMLAIKKPNMTLANEYAEEIIKRINVETIDVEKIQNIVIDVLAEHDNYLSGVYSSYREERALLRVIKKSLNVEDDLKLPKNSIEILESRYLLKDENGVVKETPKQLFERVGKAVAVAELAYSYVDGLKFKGDGITYFGEFNIKNAVRVLEYIRQETKHDKMQNDTKNFLKYCGEYGGFAIDYAEKFIKLMSSLTFLPNTPTLMNAGTELGSLSACFVLPVEDSLEDIFDAVKNTALIHKTGGGTGFNFSKLRPKNDFVKSTQGVASGPVSFMKVFDSVTEEIKQGGKRRGANMAILKYNHPDIMEFVLAKDTNNVVLKNFNVSVAVDEDFFKALQRNDYIEFHSPRRIGSVGHMKAKDLFDTIALNAWKSGDPGLIFLDRVNEDNFLEGYGDIEATNPCVTGDTLLYTSKGIFSVKELYDAQEAINPVIDSKFCGERVGIGTNVFYTGNKKVYNLKTKEGYSLKATEYHPVYSEDRKSMIKLKDLRVGEKIRILQSGGEFGSEGSLELGRVIGAFIGDGSLSKRSELAFWGDERELSGMFSEYVSNIANRKIGIVAIPQRNEEIIRSVALTTLAENIGLINNKLQVPNIVFGGSREMQIGFLQGLFQTDGTIGFVSKGSHRGVRLTSISETLLGGVQKLLLNFGIYSRVYMNRKKSGEKLLPDGHGGKKVYKVQALHELVISRRSIIKFANEIGFLGIKKQEKLKRAINGAEFYKEDFSARIESIEYVGEEDVYDLTEYKTHTLVFNGIVTSNCGEQPLHDYESCNLGSINLAKFVDSENNFMFKEFENTVKLATRFLDDVVDVNVFPIPQLLKMNRESRRIGLGVMGLADMFVEMGIKYDSLEALNVASLIMETLQKVSYETSEYLAREKYPYPNVMREQGIIPGHYYSTKQLENRVLRRNSAVQSIAPTGTISIIANCSSSIEPYFALAYKREYNAVGVGAGLHTLYERNAYLEKELRKQNLYSDNLIAQIAQTGSLQEASNIPQSLKDVFVTAHDIDAEWHIMMQSVFQTYCDSGVSKTINLPNSASVDDVKKAYLMARELGCKGITVFRDGCKSTQVLKHIDEVKPESTKPMVDLTFELNNLAEGSCVSGKCSL